jgi:hypothetical protein
MPTTTFNPGTADEGAFFDPDAFVEDVAFGEEEEGIVFEAESGAGDEEEGEEEEEGSVASVADYQDSVAGGDELPDRMIFDEGICRAIFSQKSDGGKFLRVCGCKTENCARVGHTSMRNAPEGRASTGTYEPARARKFVDGQLESYQSEADYFAEVREVQARSRAELFAAAANAAAGETPGDYAVPEPAEEEDRKPSPVEMNPGILRPSRFNSGVAPTPEVTPPPPPQAPPFDVAALVEQMTTTLLGKIDDKFKKERKAEVRAAAGPDDPRPRGDHEKLKKKHFYAVINGRNNVNRVFGDAATAQTYVVHVPGATIFKYDDEEEAWAQIERHMKAKADFEGEERTNARDPRPMVEGRTTVGNLFEAPANPQIAYPPLELMGPDPSAKKDDELFGIDLGSEIGLRDKLCPPGTTREQAKSMSDGMPDVVALPGGFINGEEESGGDLGMMGAALEELVRRGRTENDITTKSDLHWKSHGRTALRSVKNLALLMKRCKILASCRNRVVKNTVRHAQNVLERAGWSDPGLIKAWSTNGFYARVIRDSIDAWIALHQHLLVLSLTENMPWSYVQVEIDHHVEELQAIRSTHDSRLQALCAIYTYLRDGQAGSWHSTALQYKRNAQVFSQAGRPTVDEESPSDVNFAGCPWCNTSMHSGGKIACPWKALSKQAARKKAAHALRTLADGEGPTTPTPP